MTASTMYIPRRAAAFLALAAIAATFLLFAASSAVAATYPANIKKVFMTNCVKSATAGGNVTKSDAKAYCAAALSCIEAKMSLSAFASASTKNPIIKGCEKSAAKKVFS